MSTAISIAITQIVLDYIRRHPKEVEKRLRDEFGPDLDVTRVRGCCISLEELDQNPCKNHCSCSIHRCGRCESITASFCLEYDECDCITQPFYCENG